MPVRLRLPSVVGRGAVAAGVLEAAALVGCGTAPGTGPDGARPIADAAPIPDVTERTDGAAGSGGPSDGSGGDARDGSSPGDAGGGGSTGAPDASPEASDMASASDGSPPGTDLGSTSDASPPRIGAACRGATASTSTPATALPSPPAVMLPTGFAIETIAAIGAARELAPLPNGDLLVGTTGSSVYLVPAAEADGSPGASHPFVTIRDAPVQGVTFDAATCTVYVASQHGVYALPYADGQSTATAGAPIASVRSGSIAPNRPAGDTDVHNTTSVAVGGSTLYVGAGSSCNACVEVDPTRAAIVALSASGAAADAASPATVRATRFRNPIALAIQPATGTLWAGGAGQDKLPAGHPFEFFDAVTLHRGVADYGWPDCEENQAAYTPGAACAGVVAPRIELPAYSTLIGAAFYPATPSGGHAFPAAYRGGLFLTAHGSWHTGAGGAYSAPPRVVFVAMNGDAPVTPVDWSNPAAQWAEFVGGYQLADGQTRIGRPTGIAVGAQGSLFVADDANDAVYRIRPR